MLLVYMLEKTTIDVDPSDYYVLVQKEQTSKRPKGSEHPFACHKSFHDPHPTYPNPNPPAIHPAEENDYQID